MALAGGGLLAACQASGPAPGPAATSGPAPTAAPTTGPAIAPVASVAPPTAAPGPAAKPAASPVAAASAVAQAGPSPSAAPAVAAVAPSPSAAPVAAGAAAASAPPVAGKQMYQMDAQHTGRSPYNGPRQPRLVRSFDTSLPQNMPPDPLTPRPDFQSSSAIGPDGTIYIANFPGVLFALRNSQTASDQLEAAWRFHPPLGSSLHATPALSRDGSTVYLGFSFGGFQAPPKASFYALKAPTSGTDAQVVWSVDLGAARVMASPTVGPDGAIYVGNSAGVLFAINPDGSVKWTAQTGPALKSAPALGADGSVYHATTDGKMYALSPQGQVKWTFDFGEHLGPTPLVTATPSGPGGGGGGASGVGSGASPTVGPDGTIYIGANNSNLYAVAPDGKLLWLFEAERELAGIWTTPVLSPDASVLYFGANKGGVYAVTTRDGSKRWQFPVYGSIYASSVLDGRGVLYTGTTIEHVYAVQSTSGEQVWDYDAKDQVWAAPSLRPDGSLVIANRAGLVQVLGDG